MNQAPLLSTLQHDDSLGTGRASVLLDSTSSMVPSARAEEKEVSARHLHLHRFDSLLGAATAVPGPMYVKAVVRPFSPP